MDDDQGLPKTSLAAKIGACLQPEERDSPIAWYRARTRGWTREQFDHWVATGLEPGQKPPSKRSASQDAAIEDERIGRF